jgi:hypothetical protein
MIKTQLNMETKKAASPPAVTADQANSKHEFQFTYCGFMTLYALLADAAARKSPLDDMYEKLLHHIIVGIYKKFFLQGAEIKNTYIVELSTIESIAFWLYWTDHPYSEATLTGKVLERMNEIILLLFTTKEHRNT